MTAPAAQRELVTVVVPTRNSERTLEACLRSIREQTHTGAQLIVVDNDSVDGTAGIAAEWADIVLGGGPERSAQRNLGAEVGHGTYFLFVDSDMTVDVEVIAECLQAARAGATAVVIPEVSIGEGFWTRCKALERSCYVGDADIEAARFFARDLFSALNGFDTRLRGPEDWDLHARAVEAGAVIGRTVSFIEHDEGRLTLWGLIRKKFGYGTTATAYLRSRRSRPRAQTRLFRPAFIRHRRRLLRQPITAAGMLFMKTCEFAAGGIGLAVGVLGFGNRPVTSERDA
jgi:glycosyltransferase involved in cell wall biosynthesis